MVIFKHFVHILIKIDYQRQKIKYELLNKKCTYVHLFKKTAEVTCIRLKQDQIFN